MYTHSVTGHTFQKIHTHSSSVYSPTLCTEPDSSSSPSYFCPLHTGPPGAATRLPTPALRGLYPGRQGSLTPAALRAAPALRVSPAPEMPVPRQFTESGEEQAAAAWGWAQGVPLVRPPPLHPRDLPGTHPPACHRAGGPRGRALSSRARTGPGSLQKGSPFPAPCACTLPPGQG